MPDKVTCREHRSRSAVQVRGTHTSNVREGRRLRGAQISTDEKCTRDRGNNRIPIRRRAAQSWERGAVATGGLVFPSPTVRRCPEGITNHMGHSSFVQHVG